LIYPEKLIYYTYMLLETIPYYDITKSGGRELKSIDKIINPRKIRLKKTIIALNSALRLINIAIAQQNLLNGDIMLPALDKALKSKPLIRDEAIKSLLNNPYLAHNFLIYKFSQNSTGNLEFKDNSVVFSKDKKLSIPSKEDIENKNYLYRPELVQLLKLREKIIHFALSNYSSYSISSDYFLYKDYN